MKMTKQMACAALAAALAVGIAGCGDKESSTGRFEPKVAEGAFAALVARPMEKTSLAPLCKQYGLGVTDLMKQAPDKDAQTIIKDLGLDTADNKWIAVALDPVSAEKLEDPDFTVAVATSVDLDKVVAYAQGKEKQKIDKATIAGVPAYIAVDGEKPKAYMANLDKQLILVASTSAGLEKLIALYRDGKGASADFGSFTLGANDIIRLKVAKVGENVKKSLPDPEMLKMVNQVVPDGDKIVLGMGAVELALGASGDGKNVTLDLSIETAADADADKLTTLAKTGLMAVTAQMKQAAEKDADSKAAYDTLQAVKIEAKGKVATLTAATAADAALKAIADKAKELK